MTTASASCPSSCMSSCNIAGWGLLKVSSAVRVASNSGPSPVAAKARFSPTRLLPVATARRTSWLARSASSSRTPSNRRSSESRSR